MNVYQNKLCFAGTSIGFKNIASKIAYDLRLWLDSKRTAQQPFSAQQSKSLDYDHQTEPSSSSGGVAAQVRPSASVGLTASVLAEQNEDDDEIYGEATDESTPPPNTTTTTTTTTTITTQTQSSVIATIDTAAVATDNAPKTSSETKANTVKATPPPSNDEQAANAVDSSQPSDPAGVDNSKPDGSDIQLGYNNVIASLLRTTTL